MKQSMLALLGLMGLAALISCAGASEDADKKALADERASVGRGIAPVALDFKEEEADKVGLGSYLVNAVAGCVDCHSCPTYLEGQSPFAGGSGKLDTKHYLGGGASFGAELTAPAISPNAKGLPGGLTEDQFIAVMRRGKDPKNPRRTLAVMPWAMYRNMTDEDLRAMYAYLRSIPHTEAGTCQGPGE